MGHTAPASPRHGRVECAPCCVQAVVLAFGVHSHLRACAELAQHNAPARRALALIHRTRAQKPAVYLLLLVGLRMSEANFASNANGNLLFARILSL